MKHALVTGGAGFIGSHLVDSLLTDGWRVTVVDNFDPFYARSLKQQNVAASSAHPGYTLVEADIRDSEVLNSRLPDRYDVVVHIAARAGVRPSIEQPRLYQDVNVGGTQNMLEFCRAREIRQFVFASSSSVYGVNPAVPWREEECVTRPISPYASTKVSCELLGHAYTHLFGIRFLALRFFTVYGPRQRPDLAIRKFAELMLRGERIPLFGRGDSRRDYTYIDDIIAGVRAAMDYRASWYETINLGNDHAVTLSDLVSSLEEVLGVRARLHHLPDQPGDVPQTWASIDKARTLLGYRPQTRLQDGLERFALWLESSAGENVTGARVAVT
jgi:UDP-glucuronate 4-epimerase